MHVCPQGAPLSCQPAYNSVATPQEAKVAAQEMPQQPGQVVPWYWGKEAVGSGLLELRLCAWPATQNTELSNVSLLQQLLCAGPRWGGNGGGCMLDA